MSTTIATISVGGTSETNGKVLPIPRNNSEIVSDHKENLQKSVETPDLLQTNGGNTDDKAEEKGENEIDIILNNVVCNFSVRCHLNLKQIAMNGNNVEFHREMAVSLSFLI